jgi:hypothetical protein
VFSDAVAGLALEEV